MDDMQMVDVSDNTEKKDESKRNNKKKKDKFMIGIYIALIVLVVLGSLVYFFGYDLLKPYIKV